MKIRPITLKLANSFVVKYHRHHREVVGAKFSIGIFSGDEILGVAICGRPVSRKLDNGETLEVTRLCVKEGVKNGCSKLYSACARIAKEMGYEKIITYTLDSEGGISLLASGWTMEAANVGGKVWNSSVNIIRTDTVKNLFGEQKKYPNEFKFRWSKNIENKR